ncbi:hypothetical protein ABK040_015438 [Willaertia magna]
MSERAFLFDIDGVLCNSEPLVATAVQQALIELKEKYNLTFNEPSHSALLTSIHGGTVDVIKEIVITFSPELLDKCSEVKERCINIYKQLLNQKTNDDNFPIHSSIELLKLLLKNNHKVLLVSNQLVDLIKDYIKVLKLEEYICSDKEDKRLFLGYDDFKETPKPFPDPYLKAANLLNVKASNCVVFEDSENGIKAGKGAGMYVVALACKEEEFEKLKSFGADEVVFSLLDATILKKVL